MPIQPAPTLTPPPDVPSLDEGPDVFPGKAYAWTLWEASFLHPELQDALGNVFNNAQHAQSMAQQSADSRDQAGVLAAAAATSAEAAASLSGSTVWDPAASYALGDAVWVPGTGLLFRRLVAGQSATAPQDDPANWEQIGTAATSSGPLAGPSSTAYTYDTQTRVTRIDSVQDGHALVTEFQYHDSGAIHRITTSYRGKTRIDEFTWTGVQLTAVNLIT